MDSIFDKITQAINDFLMSIIESNLSTMFDDVNDKVGTIANEVGQTPQQWNSSVFSIIQNLSETVIVPIAGLIITFVLCYELISMIMEKNNMHDVDTFMFFKYFFKACVAIVIVTNTFNIVMAVFDVGQHIVQNSSSVIASNTHIDISSALTDIHDIEKQIKLEKEVERIVGSEIKNPSSKRQATVPKTKKAVSGSGKKGKNAR